MSTSTPFFQRVIRKLNKTISSWFFHDQWVILTARGLSMESLDWSEFKVLTPPPDRYWADPFVIARGDRYYTFVEEKIYQAGLGRIACLELDVNGDLLSNQTVLEHSYHLSYPFLFEYQNQLYMLPETAQNGTVEIYRCTCFPDKWELVKVLMQDVYAVDVTLLNYQDKWWLFTNMKQGENSSSLDSLFLFWADNPLADSWASHPLNPVVVDIRSARPAGHIFTHNGRLIRPSQDSLPRYGYAINFNRITKLSETEYEEVCEVRLEPPKGKNILATHTYNRTEDLTVIDAVVRRRR